MPRHRGVMAILLEPSFIVWRQQFVPLWFQRFRSFHTDGERKKYISGGMPKGWNYWNAGTETERSPK